MGATSRKKHLRANRKQRSAPAAAPAPKPEPNRKGKAHVEPAQPDPNPNYGSCSEEELEDLLLKKLHCFYSEALSKLVGLGYDDDLALRAVLRSGHCYGGMDVVANILHNTVAFLRSNCGDESCEDEEDGDGDGDEEVEVEVEGNGPGFNGFMGFTDLRQLEEYSLEGMVCLLQQFKPRLTKVDAMWCLLMSDLHVGRASSLEITACGGSRDFGRDGYGGDTGNLGSLPLCGCVDEGCHGASLGDGVISNSAEVLLQKSSLSPSMKSLLRRNAAAFVSGSRAGVKNLKTHSRLCQCASISEGTQHDAVPKISANEQCVDSQSGEKTGNVDSMLSKFRDMILEDRVEHVTDEQKEQMIMTILQQIKDLELQVLERKDWAQQKASQAARKLCNDLIELKLLRSEREETQRLKKGKQTLDDSTMKRLAEMENALRKASGQVDRANDAVKRLENENAEIRAEIEAAKLSESESVKTCVDTIKREKKSLKRLLTSEKQKGKLQAEITDVKQKILEVKLNLAQIKDARKDAEVKLRQELMAKELALAQLEEERRLKEAAEADSKRRLEALRLKIEIDFQRHKDDLQRLEQEHSRLKASLQAAELQSNSAPWGKPGEPQSQIHAFSKSLDLNETENSLGRDGNSDRDCIICMEDEVSVVFLPCAHQVLCANCNENYGRRGRAFCPCCRMPIEQRIRVYGASS